MALRSLFSDSKHRADLAMLLVTLFWGLTFPLIRSAVSTLEPLVFVGFRFSLALLVFLPLVLFNAKARSGLRAAAVPGLILGALAGGGYITQTLGLTTVGAGRAAFITGLSVILVPLLSPVFRARPSQTHRNSGRAHCHPGSLSAHQSAGRWNHARGPLRSGLRGDLRRLHPRAANLLTTATQLDGAGLRADRGNRCPRRRLPTTLASRSGALQ